MRLFPPASLLAASLLLTGCGGGSGSGSVDPAPVTVTLLSSAALDGYAYSPSDVIVIDNNVYAGDSSTEGLRGFVSFDMAAIPPGATVLSATVSLYQFGVIGTPYAVLGRLLVDHVDFGASLDADDYALPALLADIGTLSADSTAGYKTLTVTAQVLADRAAARGRSQFRVRFEIETDGDADSDACGFQRAATSPANQVPILVVTYQP